jgi:S1-C subfamily serine protease
MRVYSIDQLVVDLREHRVGEAVEITFLRGGATRTLSVVLQDKQSS